jgi:hypothetical protein
MHLHIAHTHSITCTTHTGRYGATHSVLSQLTNALTQQKAFLLLSYLSREGMCYAPSTELRAFVPSIQQYVHCHTLEEMFDGWLSCRFFNGFLFRLDVIPNYWKWYSYIDFMRCSWTALMVNQFSGDMGDPVFISKSVLHAKPQHVFLCSCQRQPERHLLWNSSGPCQMSCCCCCCICCFCFCYMGLAKCQICDGRVSE